MIPFEYQSPSQLGQAASQIDHDNTQAIAGGTTMVDLMKLNVLKPKRLVHVRAVLPSTVEQKEGQLHIGAGCTMSDLADHPGGGNEFPVLRQALILAASPQIRNMATLGGNLLQRTRSTYYRHVDMPIDGRPVDNFGEHVDSSHLALLGNGGRLVAMYPGDFANALVAFDGSLQLVGKDGSRTVQARSFYKQPRDSFQYTTDLRPGEILSELRIPISESLRNSLYLKIRDRSSYAFALASAAIGLVVQDGSITAAHVGLGGLGSIPWHSSEAEDALVGSSATDATFQRAADAALASAEPPTGLEFKVPLAKRTLVRALKILRDNGPLNDQQLWRFQHGRSA